MTGPTVILRPTTNANYDHYQITVVELKR
jgi:hypothetical protein